MTAPEHDASRRPQSRFAAAAVEKVAMQHGHRIEDNTFIVVQHIYSSGWMGPETRPWRMVARKGDADFSDLFETKPTAEQQAEFTARAEAFFSRLPVDLPITMVDDPAQAEQQIESVRAALQRAGLNDDFEAQTFAPLARASVLTEAQGLVHGARNAAYGHPLDDFTRTAAMASAMLAHKLAAPLTAEDVGMFMCCVKLSRQVNAPKRDNMVDLAGYAETVQWCIDEREVRK